MALLDYMFPMGDTMQPTPGLLGEDEAKKLRQQAQSAGLLNFGAALLANSGATQQPMNFGQRLAPAILGGYQAAQGTLEDQQKMLAARAKALEPKTMSVKEGETVYRINKSTGLPEVYLEGGAKEPPKIKEFVMAREKGLIPENMTFPEYQKLGVSGGTNITVNTEKSYGGAFAGKVADQDVAMLDAARRAPSVLESVNRSKELLAGDKVFTGALANQKLELAKFGQAIGATGKNTDELVANTQGLMSTRAQATLDSIKASGLGSGQGFTDKDRQFLENAKLGNITYSKEALNRQLDIEAKVAKGTVNAWNTRVKELPKSAIEPLGLGEVSLPKQETITTKRKVYNPATGRVE